MFVASSVVVGFLTGHKVVGIEMVIEDGASHIVDSSEMAFMVAGRLATWTHLPEGNPVVLEPVMSGGGAKYGEISQEKTSNANRLIYLT